MDIKKAIMSSLLIMLAFGPVGCGYDYRSLLPGAETNEAALIRVNIRFNDEGEAECYVKSLGIDPEAQVYAGGPSMNYMYDRDGNIIGSYNYQNVLYMKVLPDNPVTND